MANPYFLYAEIIYGNDEYDVLKALSMGRGLNFKFYNQ